MSSRPAQQQPSYPTAIGRIRLPRLLISSAFLVLLVMLVLLDRSTTDFFSAGRPTRVLREQPAQIRLLRDEPAEDHLPDRDLASFVIIGDDDLEISNITFDLETNDTMEEADDDTIVIIETAAFDETSNITFDQETNDTVGETDDDTIVIIETTTFDDDEDEDETTDTPSFSELEPFGPIQYVGSDGGFFAPYPLSVCQGGCDTDADCDFGLYCYQRASRYDDRAPGCTGGDKLGVSFDVCVYNTASGLPRPRYPATAFFREVQYVGNDGTWYDPFPLGICKGDCDTDADCGDGLVCYQRTSNGFVPGCKGGEDEASIADFCIWDTVDTNMLETFRNIPVIPEDSFRLKLYWEEGYLWQNETFEREWCMTYNFDGYPGTGSCWYGPETQNCSSTDIYMAQCSEEEPRQWFTFLDLGSEYTDNDDHPEVMIQTRGELDPRCVTRRGSALYLDADCDPDDNNQRFYALRGGFEEERFELSQYRVFGSDTCVTNAHHPKSGEVVEFHDCVESRLLHDETSFWEIF